MSYIRLDIENLEEVGKQVERAFLEQDRNVTKIADKVKVSKANARKSRKLIAVDSGLNSAYETPFVLYKAAVVDDEINVDQSSSIYLFHVNNYQTDRLKRLLMQQTLYEALSKKVGKGEANGSMVLIDGTITLKVFYPTLRDSKEYKEHFRNFYKKLYSPLLDSCLERDVLLAAFLKRTGSTYLGEHLGAKELYDIYIMHALLKSNGDYIPPIPIVDHQAKSIGIHQEYVTLYLNLNGWNYRFELLKEQENKFHEAVENLLYWTTEANYGMNPVFSKADEYARVSKREANLKFNYIIHGLPEEERTRLRMEARSRTHFGYATTRLPRKIMES